MNVSRFLSLLLTYVYDWSVFVTHSLHYDHKTNILELSKLLNSNHSYLKNNPKSSSIYLRCVVDLVMTPVPMQQVRYYCPFPLYHCINCIRIASFIQSPFFSSAVACFHHHIRITHWITPYVNIQTLMPCYVLALPMKGPI